MKSSQFQRGFTLVEVLVALAILALSLTAIYRAVSTGLVSGGRANEQALLALEAQSRLAEIGTVVALEPSGIARPLDADGRWSMQATPVSGLFGAERSNGVQLYDVELTGRTSTGTVLSFHTYKLSRQNPQ